MDTLLTTDVDQAAGVIRRGGLVAFPTETVYGLGADAEDAGAVRRIFEAKGRPADNPLIVHVSERRQIDPLVRDVPAYGTDLMDTFFPGPLTLVFRRSDRVPDEVTAGLHTVAVRMPDHPVAREFLCAAGRPVAAPSANRSGRPSPTTWQAVRDDLGGRIDVILKGGQTRVGLESTVVDCTGNAPVVLRHGSIALDDLRLVLPAVREAAGDDRLESRSPGTRHRHYRPEARVVVGPVQDASAGQTLAWIGINEPPPGVYDRVRIVQGVDDYARSLFAFFRECETEGVDVICCEPIEEKGLGRALMDRLRRASD